MADEIRLDLIRGGLVFDFCRVSDRLRIRPAGTQFIKIEWLGLGIFLSHPQRGNQLDEHLLSGVGKISPHLDYACFARMSPN